MKLGNRTPQSLRDELMDMGLWPESDGRNPATDLNVALELARKALQTDYEKAIEVAPAGEGWYAAIGTHFGGQNGESDDVLGRGLVDSDNPEIAVVLAILDAARQGKIPRLF